MHMYEIEKFEWFSNKKGKGERKVILNTFLQKKPWRTVRLPLI